ncbi:hypothetical protein NW752_001645 [Fusarium irregulare]|uniref:Zn(2)-C6 fungal-type domain-containing protein n=1 Tax=Fusarium irregulare TaxID=2494466 RepID=A0A9W8UCV5_9HYPO|nr:hypothetical protein NW766_003805 [Fusarium irregulare]KAJ4026691.1 hypothetical protein NW752_001645 [Fusarium irregulare]
MKAVDQKKLVILPKKTKWQRASKPKVRTGCLTWHLKCDEEKPTCRRCRDGRVKCDGYATPDKAQLQQRAAVAVTVPSTPYPLSVFNPSLGDTSIESCYFHHFHHWTSTQLTCAPGQSNFYLTVVLPLAHQCEPIRHAIIAVGAAHRFYMAGPETCSPLQQLKGLAMQQYNKAIANIIPHMSLNSPFDIQCTLVCCLLFVAFEGITGRYAESIRHIRAGTRLLSSPSLVTNAYEARIASKLLDMFSSLGCEASAFIEDTIIPDIRTGYFALLSSDDVSETPFKDLDEAASALRRLDVETVEVMAEMTNEEGCGSPGSTFFRDMDVVTKARIEASWNRLDEKFNHWSRRFDMTKSYISMWEYQEWTSPQLLYLNMQQAFWRMSMSLELEDDSEPDPETVETYLTAAEAFAHRLIVPGQRTFSLDGDLISSLSFLLWCCTEPHQVERALNLLRNLNRREGIWDSRDLAEMHEAAMAMGDPKIWYEKDIPGGVPGFMAELAKMNARYGLNMPRSALLVESYDSE